MSSQAGATRSAASWRSSASSIDDVEIASMIWFVITDQDDGPDAGGQGHQHPGRLGGADHRQLKRYQEAGLSMPLLWPPFADVPVAKTLDDLRRLKEDIMPKVDAAGARARQVAELPSWRERGTV